MDKLLGGLFLIASGVFALVAAKYGSDLVKKMEEEEVAKSKEAQKAAQEALDRALEKAVTHAVSQSLSRIGYKPKRHYNP